MNSRDLLAFVRRWLSRYRREYLVAPFSAGTEVILYCRKCDHSTEFPRNWLTDADACSNEKCRAVGQWRTINEPTKPYDLNHNDRKFLQAIRIAAD